MFLELLRRGLPRCNRDSWLLTNTVHALRIDVAICRSTIHALTARFRPGRGCCNYVGSSVRCCPWKGCCHGCQIEELEAPVVACISGVGGPSTIGVVPMGLMSKRYAPLLLLISVTSAGLHAARLHGLPKLQCQLRISGYHVAAVPVEDDGIAFARNIPTGNPGFVDRSSGPLTSIRCPPAQSSPAAVLNCVGLLAGRSSTAGKGHWKRSGHCPAVNRHRGKFAAGRALIDLLDKCL